MVKWVSKCVWNVESGWLTATAAKQVPESFYFGVKVSEKYEHDDYKSDTMSPPQLTAVDSSPSLRDGRF